MVKRSVIGVTIAFVAVAGTILLCSWLMKGTVALDVALLSGLVCSLVSLLSVIFVLNRGNLVIRLLKHWRIVTLKHNIKEINIGELLPGIFDNKVELMKLSWKFGDITDAGKLTLLCLLAKQLKAKNVFEIGTFRGRTTLNFALNVSDDARVYTLDLPNPDTPVTPTTEGEKKYMASLKGGEKTGEVFMGEDIAQEFKDKIISFRCNSKEFDFNPYYGTMDIVFVDGGHTFDVIESDTRHAMKMIHDKGIVVWDDYTAYWPGVKYYLDRLSKDKKLYGDRFTGLIMYSPSW